jgi:hypothetical protein
MARIVIIYADAFWDIMIRAVSHDRKIDTFLSTYKSLNDFSTIFVKKIYSISIAILKSLYGLFFKKPFVIAFYSVVSLTHLAFSLLFFFNKSLCSFHFTCAKVAAFYIYSFLLPKGFSRANHFDMHHASIGLVFSLLPGKLRDFGKWVLICDLFNFDEFHALGRGKRCFVKTQSGEYLLEYSSQNTYPKGLLHDLSLQISLERKQNLQAFPADDFMRKNKKVLFKELFTRRSLKILKEIAIQHNYIIEKALLPTFVYLKNNPKQNKMPMYFPIELFKMKV